MTHALDYAVELMEPKQMANIERTATATGAAQ